MKRRFVYLVAAGAAILMAAACNKVGEADMVLGEGVGDEIVIGCEGDFVAGVDTENYTKATAITAVPSSVYWGATTGAVGSEAQKWAPASVSTSSSKINTGKYQSATAVAYNYYVANTSFSLNSTSKHMVTGTITNATDFIAGRTASSTSTTPSVTLDHVFARTGTFTCNTQSGYTISNVSWKIKSKGTVTGTAGVYDLTSASWSSASTTLSEQAVTNSSDLYLIPGTYTITCSYTLTLGDWSGSFTKTADVTLVKGKINNITATATGGSASQIVISLSVTAWSNNAITATWN